MGDGGAGKDRRRRWRGSPRGVVTVKHRLGVADASTYDARADRLRGDDDEEAVRSCREFVRAISAGGAVSKVIVHARLGVLGWGAGLDDGDGKSGGGGSAAKKVKAKKASRLQTRLNRSVPPLRPGAVEALAREFHGLEVVTNGGMMSLDDVRDHMRCEEGTARPGGGSSVLGAMAGRAVVNHPCAFAAADELWQRDGEMGDDNSGSDADGGGLPAPPSSSLDRRRLTRGRVLAEYAVYRRESRVASLGTSDGQMDLSVLPADSRRRGRHGRKRHLGKGRYLLLRCRKGTQGERGRGVRQLLLARRRPRRMGLALPLTLLLWMLPMHVAPTSSTWRTGAEVAAPLPLPLFLLPRP